MTEQLSTAERVLAVVVEAAGRPRLEMFDTGRAHPCGFDNKSSDICGRVTVAMALNKALYYPFIDIQEPAWVRTACLYWETIQTIVPDSIDNPYQTRDTEFLADEGILIPLRVHPEMPEIQALGDDIVKYLESPEGVAMLMPDFQDPLAHMHVEKLPHQLRRLLRDVKLYPEKLGHRLGEFLRARGPLCQQV